MATLATAADGETTHHLGVRTKKLITYAIVICLLYMYLMPYRYKILFLDVLFPLSVKKIIFVDADQVHKLIT